MGKQWKQWDFILRGSKITAGGYCCHETKRRLLLGRKVMTNLDSILKSRDITLPTKVHLVKAMVFPMVMYGCECWTIKKAEHKRIDAFELWCWRRLLRVPWTARRSNQSILKEISPENSLEGLMLKLKLQHFGHLMRRTDAFELWCWRLLRVSWTAKDSTSSSYRKSVLKIHWKDWCWSWNSNTLSTWCEELTHLKRPWCFERLKVGREGDDRGWDGWMASQTQLT